MMMMNLEDLLCKWELCEQLDSRDLYMYYKYLMMTFQERERDLFIIKYNIFIHIYNIINII